MDAEDCLAGSWVPVGGDAVGVSCARALTSANGCLSVPGALYKQPRQYELE